MHSKPVNHKQRFIAIIFRHIVHQDSILKRYSSTDHKKCSEISIALAYIHYGVQYTLGLILIFFSHEEHLPGWKARAARGCPAECSFLHPMPPLSLPSPWAVFGRRQGGWVFWKPFPACVRRGVENTSSDGRVGGCSQYGHNIENTVRQWYRSSYVRSTLDIYCKSTI